METVKEWKPHDQLTWPQGCIVDFSLHYMNTHAPPCKIKYHFTAWDMKRCSYLLNRERLLRVLVKWRWRVYFHTEQDTRLSFICFPKLLFRNYWGMWTGAKFKCMLSYLVKQGRRFLVLYCAAVFGRTGNIKCVVSLVWRDPHCAHYLVRLLIPLLSMPLTIRWREDFCARSYSEHVFDVFWVLFKTLG